MTDEYNGWSNRETWCLKLWLDNDQGLYSLAMERASDALHGYADDSDRLKARVIGDAIHLMWDELTDPSECDDGSYQWYVNAIVPMVRDVGSDYRVNWDEIGSAYLSDMKELGEYKDD